MGDAKNNETPVTATQEPSVDEQKVSFDIASYIKELYKSRISRTRKARQNRGFGKPGSGGATRQLMRRAQKQVKKKEKLQKRLDNKLNKITDQIMDQPQSTKETTNEK